MFLIMYSAGQIDYSVKEVFGCKWKGEANNVYHICEKKFGKVKGIYQTMKLKQECSSWKRFEAQCFLKKGIMLYKCTQLYLYFGPFLLIVCAWHPCLPHPSLPPPSKNH